MTKEKLETVVPMFAIACLCATVLVLAIVAALKPDPERARFMLDCVDYQYKAETCEAIWDGEDPPQVPDALGEPGC